MSYPAAILMRQEGTTRFAFAKWYEALEQNEQLERANAILIDRVETILNELLGLLDDVLFERNVRAFCHAYRIRSLIVEFLKGARR